MVLKKSNRGFTLVEVLVVLVILAILAAVSIPTMSGFIDEAKKKGYTAEARSVYVAAQVVTSELSSMKGSISEDDPELIDQMEQLLGADVDTSSYQGGIELNAEGTKVIGVTYTTKEGDKIIIKDGTVEYR